MLRQVNIQIYLYIEILNVSILGSRVGESEFYILIIYGKLMKITILYTSVGHYLSSGGQNVKNLVVK